MSLLARLALLFVVVPILELILLLELGQLVGLWPTLGLVLATGVAGAALARAEGMRVFWAFQSELAAGKLPGQALQDGISVLVGGAFLLTPGILTDFVGFSLLLPPTRRWIQARLRSSMEKRIRDGSVRFVVTGAGPLGGFGFRDGDGSFQGGPFGGGSQPSHPGDLDPSKEIRVDSDG